MKKTYSKPEIRIVQLQQRTMLLSGSGRSVKSNAVTNYDDSGSSGESRSRGNYIWDDWDDEEDY